MSTPYLLPTPRPFRPRYVLPSDLPVYGLPDAEDQPNILSLVDLASLFIDEYLGRKDGNGAGSLVYCTYQERYLLQARGRNIFRLNFKPLAVVPPSVVTMLAASASQVQGNDPLANVNYWYTGVQPNTVVSQSSVPGVVSPIIGASGRYGYPRRGEQAIYPDLNYGMNLLQVAAFFGGPPVFTAIDPTSIDFDTANGEVWIPAGLYMSQYTEVIITYNAGYSPIPMPGTNVQTIPPTIKAACVALIKNFLAQAGGTLAIKQMMAAGQINYTFTDKDLDPTTARLLENYKTIIAY